MTHPAVSEARLSFLPSFTHLQMSSEVTEHQAPGKRIGERTIIAVQPLKRSEMQVRFCCVLVKLSF